MTTPDRPIHPAAKMYATEASAGLLSRREFLARVTALGVPAAIAYGLLGLEAPAARAQTVRAGGTLRIQMDVQPMKDPRLWDWSEIANFGRGWLEYLVELQQDGSFRGMLLEAWDANEDATEYVLHLRPGVKWNNGDSFTVEDVAHNIRRWCEADVEGNSMTTRMGDLVDPGTGRIRDDAIELVDDLTLRLRLPSPDIALIANVADYPAAIVHRSYHGGDPIAQPIGTGPFLPEAYEVGVRGVLVNNEDHDWWGARILGGATLDRIEFLDFGTDPANWVEAIETGVVDMLYESVGEFVAVLDTLDLVKSEAVTANTLVIRANQRAEIDGRRPYADARVRKALQLAVDNSILLELGYLDLGVVAENHHVAPVHPEYAEIEDPAVDPARAVELLEEAGMAGFQHELISLDDDYQRVTADAVAAQLLDADIPVARTILPISAFTANWTQFPFSVTEWNHRPLGVQVLALAYRSGQPWNETGFSNARFDELLAKAMAIADADQRREIMAELERIMQAEGVVIQPYWRTTFRHYREEVTGAQMHPTFEIHLYKLGLLA